ncbi:hypothetical protein VPH35_061358 [Triticum aestivum]
MARKHGWQLPAHTLQAASGGGVLWCSWRLRGGSDGDRLPSEGKGADLPSPVSIHWRGHHRLDLHPFRRCAMS